MSETLLQRRYFITHAWVSGYTHAKVLKNMPLSQRDAIMEKGEQLAEKYADLVINKEDFKHE